MSLYSPRSSYGPVPKAPFFGAACEFGECQPGYRLDRNAEVNHTTEKYRLWEACAPCQLGLYKEASGNQECDLCPEGLVPNANRSGCVQCPLGLYPTNLSSCGECPAGSVAPFGALHCTPCKAGTAPNVDHSECVRCADGQVAAPRSAQCTSCELGSVPDASRTGCLKCAGQHYALEGDEKCRRCSFPSMVLGEENWCTSLYFFLFLLAFLLLALLVAAIFGKFRLECFKIRLRTLVKQQDWCQLYATRTSAWEYGIWHPSAQGALETQKAEVKTRSFQLGISLHYVFEELEAMYREKALQGESSYFVKLRNMGQNVPDREAAWNALPPCPAPEDPNFHQAAYMLEGLFSFIKNERLLSHESAWQVAGLMAYGPLALGKGQYCPRDGRLDCSIVDALEASQRSGRATWFLSWVWGYKFSTVFGALSRWWRRHQIVSGDACGNVYIWWCVMVNNQFRMLEEGQTAEPWLGTMKFGVFVACTHSIPTTVILPQLELDGDGIETLQELTQQCRVDAQSAQASVPEDAVAIKERIMEDGKKGNQPRKVGRVALVFVVWFGERSFLVMCVEEDFQRLGLKASPFQRQKHLQSPGSHQIPRGPAGRARPVEPRQHRQRAQRTQRDRQLRARAHVRRRWVVGGRDLDGDAHGEARETRVPAAVRAREA
eukprot:s1106_g4.t1